MYEFIRGNIAELSPTYAIIECGGVGYHISISLHTFSQIENVDEAKLYTHYIVREDAQLLYGFFTKLERDLFRLLISVSGVGGNTARMVLSTYSAGELKSIIATQNALLLKNVKGLGLKTAQKIIVDLSSKMVTLGVDGVEIGESPQDNTAATEAIEALVMLGFVKSASQKVVKSISEKSPNLSVEEIIREALKRL
ncbi:MAG: Holliday junction branch migration protein RuvA [Rikenellaceae bacterium]